MTKRYFLGSFAATAQALAAFGLSHGNAADEPTVTDLTQTACHFVEVEG